MQRPAAAGIRCLTEASQTGPLHLAGSGRAGGGLGAPPLANGCLLDGSPGAGELFPQPWATVGDQVARFDDVAGPGPWLITRTAAPPATGLTTLSLDGPRLAPFAPEITAWLDRKEADAILVRPDRYVFGTGTPDALAASWAGALKPSGG